MIRHDLARLADLWEAQALAAIGEARAAVDGTHTGTVDLYIYDSEADFEKAGGEARYGVDWWMHGLLMAETARRLRARGYEARLTPFTDDPGEPTNLHEPTADERTGK